MGVFRGSCGVGVCASFSLCLWLCVWMVRTSAVLSQLFLVRSGDVRGDDSGYGAVAGLDNSFFAFFVFSVCFVRGIFVNG